MNTVVLPAGWEHQAAPAATMFDRLGPPLAWWSAAFLLLALAVLLVERRPGLSLVLALLSTPILAIAANGLVDDAYIQFRYATNVVAGHGPVFNPGERVEGASGGIWIGVLALAGATSGLDTARCGRILSLVAACFASWCAAAFGRTTGGPRGAARAAIVWAAVPTSVLYAATGLETSAFALGLWGLAAAVARDRRGPAALAGVLVATLRPEGAILALGATPFWSRLGRAGRAALLGTALGAAAIACGRLLFYGLPVPRSALVKGVLAPAGPDQGLLYLGAVALEWWPLLPALAWLGARYKALLPILAPAALLTILVVLRGGDWMPGGRYLLPLLVVLAAGAAILPAARTSRWLVAGSAAWGLLLLSPLTPPPTLPAVVPLGRAWRAMAEGRAQSRWWESLGTWAGRSLPPGTRLAAGPSGALPYASRLATFDLYGLCSPVTHQRGGEAGHRLWGLSEALAAGVDVVYPGRSLAMVEDLGALLPAAQRQVGSEPNLMVDYRPLTIVHAPEYRFDYLRDEIWIRREVLPAIPHPGAGPLGR
ncbi:MAG TPA: hypothetical protein VGV60_06245 [Candidatus Polarisedimenticolia bacterium]|nr:hypothetical protein [Candidatus Polarisedimenticolia bacterium]